MRKQNTMQYLGLLHLIARFRDMDRCANLDVVGSSSLFRILYLETREFMVDQYLMDLVTPVGITMV